MDNNIDPLSHEAPLAWLVRHLHKDRPTLRERVVALRKRRRRAKVPVTIPTDNVPFDISDECNPPMTVEEVAAIVADVEAEAIAEVAS